MSTDPAREEAPIDAGELAPWAAGMQAALRNERDADVPCDGCTACCRSSQFVPIEPDETDTLARVPAELRFPAPRRPRGHVLLGYDERGHCPMLVDDACSIYAHRPRACRTYDCRVFAATGVELGEPEKSEIARRVRRWRFRIATTSDRACAEALDTAAQHVRGQGGAAAPVTATELAVRAVESHDRFLPTAADAEPCEEAGPPTPG